MRVVRGRFAWLVVNLLTAVVASMVIGAFQGTIEKLVALAVLMPIVASMGGNAGTQTVTVAVRALAMRELTSINALRFVLRETLVGSVNAVAFAVVAGAVSWFWFDDPMVAGIMAAAMAVNLVVAGLFGTVVPLTLDRLGVDPAVASSVFMTTVTDVIGFLSWAWRRCGCCSRRGNLCLTRGGYHYRHALKALSTKVRMIPNSYPTYEFSLGETAEMLRAQVAAFAADEIAPIADTVDRSDEFPRQLWPKMGDLGLLGVTVEEEYGGAGMGYTDHVVAMEEVSRASGGIGLSYGAFNLCVNQIRLNGNGDQRRRYLPKLISGAHVGALAMSESGAGSDVVSMQLRAEKKATATSSTAPKCGSPMGRWPMCWWSTPKPTWPLISMASRRF